MQRNKITDDLERVAFDFFYWFSRFEFALKENGYLKSDTPGSNAEPSWRKFVEKWQYEYTATRAAKALIAAKPQRQVVGRWGALDFEPVRFDDNPSELGAVVRLAKTVRNNLFHGGKHGSAGWDDPDRTQQLLKLVISV